MVCAVHGDDFTFVGPRDDLEKIEEQMKEKYQLTRGAFLGPGPQDDKEGMVLNRVVRWCEDRIEYEADPRQAEKFVYELGLEGATSLVTPGIKVNLAQLDEDTVLTDEKASLFRATSARSNLYPQVG